MRVRDWPKRLSGVLTASIGRDLIWGERDCFTFAGDVAAALTGVDPVSAMRGRYASYAEGLMLARELYGVIGLRGYADRLFSRTPFAMAQRGDWALVRGPGGWALAIVDGPMLRDAWGSMIPLAEARICWRVE